MVDEPNINHSESNQESSIKKDSSVKVELHKETENFVPEDFKSEPLTYFNEKGVNIKNGEIKYDEDGTVREDPTAVKDLPNWENSNGEIIPVVGRKEADMIFDIDETTGNIKKIIPTDWERTKVDLNTFNEMKNKMTREGLSMRDLLLTPEERIRKIDEEIFETEEEIVKFTRNMEETESAIKEVRDNLGLITQNETSPSIEQLKIKIEELREQREEMERKREKFAKKDEIEKALEHEILILLKEKIDEIFERFSKLENIEFEHLALNGFFRNGDQLELSNGLKIPADITKKLIIAYKENITDLSELLNFIPELIQAKSALREEASKRIGNQ